MRRLLRVLEALLGLSFPIPLDFVPLSIATSLKVAMTFRCQMDRVLS